MPNTQLELPTQIDLTQFISVEAHDLRTPFNHIVGFGKMLLNSLSDAPLTDFQKEDLTTVYRSSLRALTLLNGLIDIARISRREKELSPTVVEIKQLVDKALAQWKKFNPANPIQAECQIAVAAPSVLVDEVQIQQVIFSLIMYVTQYTDAQPKVALTFEEERGWLVATIASDGKKVAALSKLDLDLHGYISRAFIEMHHGHIRRAEETDTGASIQFDIPKL